MGLLYYVSYFAVLAAFAFVTLSLASGLLYVSELIEEHSRLAKLVGQRGIYVVISLHVLLYFTDSLPPLQTIFSIACHVVYLQNFSHTWPLISLTSPSFLASCVLVIADHFIWFFHFARITNEARHLRTYRGLTVDVPSFIEIASFFGLCVWLAPLFLFLSLSANDNALPMSALEPSSPSVGGFSSQQVPQRQQHHVSLIRSIFYFFSFDSIPRMRPRPSRKNTSEGIIAPRSPAPIPSPLPNRPSSPLIRSSYSGPPRSPGPRAQELDVHLSPNTNFRLDTPPRRPAPPIRRTTTGEGLGLGIGMRRSKGPSVDD